ATSSGCVYNFELSTSVLSTPSSSPPVTPNSISTVIPSGFIRSKYFLEISIFSSIDSSDRSSICEENKGFPCCAKNFSPASKSPSIQGNNFLAAWSVCKRAATHYCAANKGTCCAADTAPKLQACNPSLFNDFPA